MDKVDEYLLRKLAEEAAEVAHAALKLINGSGSRAALDHEVGDLEGVYTMLIDRGIISNRRAVRAANARIAKEAARCKKL